ncbi:MAG: hypothetical protein GEV09_17895 [Pseudonocardiaceae bacterium]|nr:hypothetical protein [Pseudonocardiaceae bacterium]
MPSSLIFAALAAAWLVVLVPIVAKRRQEVVRTADSALASRVLRRPIPNHHGEEVPSMVDETAEPELEAQPRFRPGRGGYDPDAAALAARAKYVFRQRVVVGLSAAAVVTLVLAFAMSSTFWWVHAALDASLVGYLGYLRRQVRIEDEVRRRRAARLDAARRRPAPPVEDDQPDEPVQPPLDEEPVVRAAPPPPVHPTAVAVDLDDEDPAFDELDPSFEPAYRRAAGE